MSDLMSLVRSPLAESFKATNYDEEERKILNNSVEVSRLIKQLGRTKNESEEKK